MKENLENSKNGEFLKRGSSWDLSSEKCRGQSGVVLKVSILEEKFKEVLTQQRLFCGFLGRYRVLKKLEMNGDYSCIRQIRIEFVDVFFFLIGFEKVFVYYNCYL